ncbi:MAG TPA: DAK2 domain-containing protein [Symbiobacteriaceae bacterium]
MSIQAIDGNMLKEMIRRAARTLESNQDAVNALNVFPVPDGDTGTNMSMTMASATREVEQTSGRTVGEVAAALAQGSLMGARGNSGVILSQLFRGFAKACNGHVTLDALSFALALQEGVDTAYRAVMKPVEGTILTVAREAAEAAVQAARRHKSPVTVMRIALEAAESALARTPDLLPVLKKAGVVDSGGKGLTFIYRGYYEALAGMMEAEPEAPPTEEPQAVGHEARHDVSPAAHIEFRVDEEISTIRFPYDCELFIRRHPGGRPIPLDEVAERLEPMGDSVYVVGSEDLAKVHIHASNPGPVLSLCIEYGELYDIVIHNMRQQHKDLLEHARREEPAPAADPAPAGPDGQEPAVELPPDAINVVAVAVGDGLEAIFRSLGATEVVHGGQTMNPSTQDLLAAINRCPAQQVLVLPNNKNVILAAQQAAALAEKRVLVVPTRSIPEGIAAMIAFMPEGDVEKVQASMARAIEQVQTGEVTFSVRDTTVDDLQIRQGDILGLWNDRITLTGQSPEEVVKGLLQQMVEQCGGEVISLYWGEGVDEARAQALAEELRRIYPDHEVEVQYGGQPLYYYVFSLE